MYSSSRFMKTWRFVANRLIVVIFHNVIYEPETFVRCQTFTPQNLISNGNKLFGQYDVPEPSEIWHSPLVRK